MNQLARSGIKVTTFALGQPSLDEVFLALTGHAARRTDAERTDAERTDTERSVA